MNLEEKIKHELATVNTIKHYNGWADKRKEEYGYHSFTFPGVSVKGQRDPKVRLNAIQEKLHLEGKVIVDLGCNTGGMLLHLNNVTGYGFDIDKIAINAANNISKLLGKDSNFKFYDYDFDHQPIQNVSRYIDKKPDVVFALSIGKWIKKHRELYQHFINMGVNTFVLEINNKQTGKSELKFFDELGWTKVTVMEKSIEDTTGNTKRKTFIISKS